MAAIKMVGSNVDEVVESLEEIEALYQAALNSGDVLFTIHMRQPGTEVSALHERPTLKVRVVTAAVQAVIAGAA